MQVAVDTVNHLIVTHEVTNTGSDRAQLANVAREAKAVLQVDKLEAVADRGYFNGEEILACEQAGICVTLPKPMTSGAKSEGRFGKQDFVYIRRRMSIAAPLARSSNSTMAAMSGAWFRNRVQATPSGFMASSWVGISKILLPYKHASTIPAVCSLASTVRSTIQRASYAS